MEPQESAASHFRWSWLGRAMFIASESSGLCATAKHLFWCLFLHSYVLRLRSLRRCSVGESSVLYGFHSAIHMAIGFLFLAGGRYTAKRKHCLSFSTNYFSVLRHSLATDNASIAALVVALFPRFPSAPNDNRYYFQPFRHL